MSFFILSFFFFFNDPATTEIYTLSLHDALPICMPAPPIAAASPACFAFAPSNKRASMRQPNPGKARDEGLFAHQRRRALRRYRAAQDAARRATREFSAERHPCRLRAWR